jgi:arsenite methyltransferase
LIDELRSVVTTESGAGDASTSVVKQCCAALYESDAASLLLGESFHPGGTGLTELAARFGCEVVGIDYGGKNVEEAVRNANDMGLSERVSFWQGDAERLPFADGSFDAIICECAVCTFPNKQAAANGFARVLRKGGRVGLSDLTRNGALAPELDGLLSRIACIADAQPLATYAALLSGADLEVGVIEEHDSALVELVNQMRLRLLAADVMVGLKKLALPGFDFEVAREVAKHALLAIKEGGLGYAIVTASKAT